MHSDSITRAVRALGGLLFTVALSGCFGTGDGPEPIAGTPAPPPPPSLCDPSSAQGDGSPFPLFFENMPGAYNFGQEAGFGGGATVVVENPVCTTDNVTPQVARMQKFTAELFGGSSLELSQNVDFSQGEIFTMQVWSQRAVPITFKFEDAISGNPANGVERVETHAGGGRWQTMCFDFSGAVGSLTSNFLTFIFDNGVLGDAGNDPDNWTFYMDTIEQTNVCPDAPTTSLPVDFEDDPATYQFGIDGGFGGGVSDVITNPDQSGLNMTAQTARMRKFAGEVFGGSTLQLGANFDFSQGTAFRMKVWSTRPVPVLFKLEDAISNDPNLGIERSETHPGGSTWVELCYDFAGSTGGFTSSSITFIFDIGISGNADADPNNWTFYYDEIEQDASCTGAPATALPADFESGSAPFSDFGGGVGDVITNPDQSGLNTTANTGRMRKFAGETFGGTTLALPAAVDFSQGESFTVKVWATRSVPVLFKLEDDNSTDPASGIEATVNHSGSGTWEELCYDLSGQSAGLTSSAVTFIFDNGVAGDADGAPNDWTFFFDEITQVASCGGGTAAAFPQDFESGSAAFGDFGGGVGDVITNPDQSGLNTTANTARMRKFAAEPFGGTTLTLPAAVDYSQGEAFTMKVWATRAVPVLFKLEDDNSTDPASGIEATVSHSGSGMWEELCFDLTGMSTGLTSSAATFIFDNGVVGDADGAPNDWTFFFDEIEQVASCPSSGGGGTSGGVGFESGSATFSDFGGGVGSVIANPDATGINTSGQVGQMQKFAGEIFAGTTLQLPMAVPLAAGDSYLMKVRAQREVVVTFKLETDGTERIAIHSGSGTWEELCFDFAGVDVASVTGITLIFDNGIAGDAANDPNNWTFQFDDIVQTSNACPALPASTFAPITFDDSGVAYTLADFGGNVSSITNDPTGGTNQVVQAVRTAGAETFAGTTVSTLLNNEIEEPLSLGNLVMTVRVYSPLVGIPVRLKVEDSGNAAIFVQTDTTTTVANAWETLTFDFGSPQDGSFNPINTYNRLSIFFNIDATGVGEQTYFFDDIANASAGGGGGVGGELSINGGFEAGDLSDWEVFPNGGSIAVSGTEASEGSFSVNVIASPGQNPVIKQERRAAGTVTAGQTVNISFDMKGTLATDFGAVVIPSLFSEGTVVGTDNLDTITSATADFTTYTYTTTAGADVSQGITLQIAVVCGGDPQCQANVFIDNVSFTLDSGT
ncbi:MAG: hypothetical protein AAFQ62_11770 [Pseudomonadota bacterium]